MAPRKPPFPLGRKQHIDSSTCTQYAGWPVGSGNPGRVPRYPGTQVPGYPVGIRSSGQHTNSNTMIPWVQVPATRPRRWQGMDVSQYQPAPRCRGRGPAAGGCLAEPQAELGPAEMWSEDDDAHATHPALSLSDCQWQACHSVTGSVQQQGNSHPMIPRFQV
eukprot:3071606-Rhodomonas_salina.1